MDAKIEQLLNAHKETLFFWKLTGNWAGGDMREVGQVAKAMGMAEEEIRYSCSSCLDNIRNHIINQLDPKEIQEYKQRKGL